MREPVFREPENLVEVVNQSRTYLISLIALMAVEYLMKVHPDVSFIVNGGNISSADHENGNWFYSVQFYINKASNNIC